MTKSLFIEKVAREAKRLIDSDSTVIVGLSGGADSVALLDLLFSLGYRCVVTHCNFHLRGDESDRDEAVARSHAARLGVEFIKTDFDVPERQKSAGESVEMACRSLRYEWWESLRKQLGNAVIAVAHHRDDNIETFFLNLMRGSGIAGLKGMLPRTGNIVRPMLGCTRQEIEEYCTERNLHYIVDSTNLENDYRRNRLRNIIIPEIERQFPGAVDGIARSIGCLGGNYELYRDCVKSAVDKYISPDGSVNVAAIIDGELHPRMVLFEIVSPLGLNMTHVDNILSSSTCSGLTFGNYILDRGILRPSSGETVTERVVNLTDDPKFKVTVSPRCDFSPTRDPMTIYLDEKVLDGDPVFTVRPWREGDRIAPFGMKGTRKVSDLFSDAKLSIDEKKRVSILTRNDEILWVIGLRASRHFPVTPSTACFLTITALDT